MVIQALGNGGIVGKTALLRAAIYLAISTAGLMFMRQSTLSQFYYQTQDLAVALLLMLVWMAATRFVPPVRLPEKPPSAAVVLAVASFIVLFSWSGTYWLLFNYPVSRDEQMVVFDAATYATGALGAPLPAQWEGFAVALVPAFLREIPGYQLLVSNYLPVNAAMRAGFGAFLDPALLNPLLAGIGLVVLWRIALKLFDDSPGAVWVTLAGYVLSAQILVTAMSTYAMTAHLTLNLIWLYLFLKDRLHFHVLAMVIGILAMGLHQFVFHPLFAGPFILTLVLAKRWRLFGLYAVTYAAGLLLWMSWQQIILASGRIEPPSGEGAGLLQFFKEQVLPLLWLRGDAIPNMLLNLIRFAAWNAVFLVPLLFCAGALYKRREPLFFAALGGVFLTLALCFVVLPYQGHSYGYRYLHGVLGSLFLLAGYGYREFARIDRTQADGWVGLMAGVTLLLSLPWTMLAAHNFAKQFVQITQIIDRQDADFVIVDNRRFGIGGDQVRNMPDFANRPLTFAAGIITPDQIQTLCRKGRVFVLTEEMFFGVEAMQFTKPEGEIEPIAACPKP